MLKVRMRKMGFTQREYAFFPLAFLGAYILVPETIGTQTAWHILGSELAHPFWLMRQYHCMLTNVGIGLFKSQSKARFPHQGYKNTEDRNVKRHKATAPFSNPNPATFRADAIAEHVSLTQC